MSGAIRDTEKLNQRQIETARRRNERELKNIESNHSAYKKDLKTTHEHEIVDIQDVNHRQVSQEATKKEKVLEDLKTNLYKTTELTDKQLKELKTNADRERVETHKKLTADRERINAEHELFLEELNDRLNTQTRKVTVDGKNRVEEVKTTLLNEARDTEQFHQGKIQTQTEAHTTRFQADEKNYKDLKYNQDQTFKKERLSTNQRQQLELGKMTKTHQDHIEVRDTDYRKGLKEQDLFFEKKYGVQLEQNNGQFKVLEEQNKKVIAGLKEDLTKELTKAAVRNDDPFYKFEKLEPRFKVLEDRVEVEVQVPDHSKQDLQLTLNGKEAIVSFNRRYNDASKAPDGTINKINKVESFTSRLQTGVILDAKGIKSSYDNGVMTYVIKKA
jgi:hypothetical protein